MIYPIVAYGHPILRLKAEKIIQIDSKIKKLVHDMFNTMFKANGIGLAAPQIGQSIQLFIVDSRIFGEKELYPKVFINPVILFEKKTNKSNTDIEGCLSIPGIQVKVNRWEKITIKYKDENGFEKKKDINKALPSRVIQHEYDHLIGKLCIDYIDDTNKKSDQKILKNITQGQVKTNYNMTFFKG